jgi:gluconate 2-dehydrogenase alpha chain
MARIRQETDVVIVGMGAAGGVAALPLAEAGLRVVGLEAGTWLDRRDFVPDEIRNNVRDWPFLVKKAEGERPTVRGNESETAVQVGSHPMMNAVGGTSIHYWAQSWRLNPWDFRVVSETARRYGASRIPSDSTVEDWPLDYEELERFYDVVERQLGVSGQAGNARGEIDPRGTPFEGPRSREYPMPPLRWTAFLENMAGSARQLGWHPFPGPAASTTATATRAVAM